MDMSAYLTAPLHLDRICRACLMERGDMRPLYGACLDEMLNSFASVEVIFCCSILHYIFLGIFLNARQLSIFVMKILNLL